ncbi:xylulokinase [Rubritalea tangerina]|uniref:Xylulokinase n=1 Tax=Rubritalea tangerina TaxID=430798 RepID=A0ABW4ZDP2_9BACT
MFLGLDASTQSLSAILIDPAEGTILFDESINFGAHFPQYQAPNGFIENGNECHTSPLMWLDALDLLFDKLSQSGLDLTKIEAITGAGQQHATVYLNAKFPSTLATLSVEHSLSDQLAPTLSREFSPIWMDSSTIEQCEEITQAIGSSEKVVSISGSTATPRFSGPQIRKFYQTQSENYANTHRIHLNSSFFASVLAGADAPIDYGDGAGMNLMDLSAQDWSTPLVEATAPGLHDKLPALTAAGHCFGSLSPYFAEKYGLSNTCKILTWTGDNPASLVGMGAAQPGKLVVSLGTSDTLFAALESPLTDPNGFGHVFGNPLGGYMSLICFSNGSLAREKLKESCQIDWDTFAATPTQPFGNDGKLAAPLYVDEITPRLKAQGLQTNHWDLTTADTHTKIRALLEGQFGNMRLRARWMQLQAKNLLVTGGASRNQAIRQTLANTFQCQVQGLDVSSSVGLGAAIIASVHAGYAYTELIAQFCSPSPEVTTPEATAIELEKALLSFEQFQQELAHSLAY